MIKTPINLRTFGTPALEINPAIDEIVTNSSYIDGPPGISSSKTDKETSAIKEISPVTSLTILEANEVDADRPTELRYSTIALIAISDPEDNEDCSLDVKNTLFKSYCSNCYGGELWCIFKKETYRKCVTALYSSCQFFLSTNKKT